MIKDRLARILTLISQRSFSYPVTIVAVSKYASDEQTGAMMQAGITHFGENTVQNLEKRVETFGRNAISWHLIGHLQSNKVKKAVALADMIQSVDSVRLLSKIDRECALLGRRIPVLIQVNVAGDDQKSGFSVDEFECVLPELFQFPNVDVAGIMTIGPQTSDRECIRRCFYNTRQIRDRVHSQYTRFQDISMGMSGDFDIALEEGASIIRVGSYLYS